MEAFHNINLISLVDTAISLTAAFVFGGLIGLERQYRQRTAGLRTNILVAIGAAIFVDAANRLTGHDGADDVEIKAVLTASAVDGDEMDKLITHIANKEYVSQAFWSPSTTD